MRPSFSLGIEEEYQTVDPETRDLRSHIATEMLSEGKLRLEERVKAEMHQSVIEVGTRICKNIDEAQRRYLRPSTKHDPSRRRERAGAGGGGDASVRRLAQPGDLSGPSLCDKVVEDLQLVARSNLIFGLHVHVGIEDKRSGHPHYELAAVLSLPHILALSHELAVLAGHGDRDTRAIAQRCSSIFHARTFRISFARLLRVREIM